MKMLKLYWQRMPFLLVLLMVLGLCTGVGRMIGIQMPGAAHAASDDSRYGILGKPAPELDLDGWIDGEGRKMDPVRLSDLRGKVVYLYFYQDW